MGSLAGRQTNFCLRNGVQGVVKQITTEDTSGETVYFSVNSPGNNYLYVFKGFSGGGFGTVPAEPTADYNFKVTLYKSTGFTGTLATFVRLFSTSMSDPSPVEISVKYDKPDFDLTDDYTTIHLHYWYDGINYCGKIDGYI